MQLAQLETGGRIHLVDQDTNLRRSGNKLVQKPQTLALQFHAEQAHITHRIEITGKDSPGLIARLSEVFLQFGANIVRLNSERLPGAGHAHYMLRMAVFIPEGKAATCLATVANTAAQLALTCWWEES